MAGSLPRYIYWRRRLLLVAVLIALVWVVIRLVGVFRGDGDSATPTQRQSSTTAAVQTPTPTPVVTTTPTAAPVSLSAAATVCDPEKVTTLASVPEGQFAGGPVVVTLTFTTTQKDGCSLTPEGAQLVAVIRAKQTAVYDSQVCKTSLLTTPVALPQGWASQVTTNWSGRGSGAQCTGTEKFASPGSYTLQVGTLGGEPASTNFVLARAPKPSPTPPAPASETSQAGPTPSATTAD